MVVVFGEDWVENSIKKGYFRSDAPRFNSLLKVSHRAVKEKKSKKLAMWYYTLAALYDAKGETLAERRNIWNEDRHIPKTHS